MTPDDQRARREPGPLAENSANESTSDPFAGRPLCESRGCLMPAATHLGQYLCLDHASFLYRDLRQRQARRLGVPPEHPVGLGVFRRPAPGWPVPFVVVGCEVCDAEWVAKYATFPLCEWCLDKAEAVRA